MFGGRRHRHGVLGGRNRHRMVGWRHDTSEFSVEDKGTEREWDGGEGSKPGKVTGVSTRDGPMVLPVRLSMCPFPIIYGGGGGGGGGANSQLLFKSIGI